MTGLNYHHPGGQVDIVDEAVYEELGGPVRSERGCVQSHHVARPDLISSSTGQFSRVERELGVDLSGRLRQEGGGSVQAEERSVVAEAAKVVVAHSGACIVVRFWNQTSGELKSRIRLRLCRDD